MGRTDQEGNEHKFLIGIKTFGISSKDQKIAQFKANHDNWAEQIDAIKQNAYVDGKVNTKEKINKLNHDLYLELSKSIAKIRNERIESAIQNLKGFKVKEKDQCFSVYHVIMPSKKGDAPKLFIGETSYDKIDIDNINVLGCTKADNPTNFSFEDGKHVYKYTSADSQLYMKFDSNIILEEWDVIYAEDAFTIFNDISEKIYKNQKKNIAESYSWSLLNNEGEVELFSGFNSFFAVGSKLNTDSRENRINFICKKYENKMTEEQLLNLRESLNKFLLTRANNTDERIKKVELRQQIINSLPLTSDEMLKLDIEKLLYRPLNELYIPIPNEIKFHADHPDFFGNGISKFKLDPDSGQETSKLLLPAEERKFNLVFEPSGDTIVSYLTQDYGKGIESFEKQSYLGEWILRKVFQLKEYEPLTRKKLDELQINGIRLYKETNSNNIHLQFIWIDNDELPDDYII